MVTIAENEYRLLQARSRELERAVEECVRAKEALKESEEKLRNIYDRSPIGIEVYDAGGALLDANRACLDIFGVADIEEVKGFKLFEDPNVTDDVKQRSRRGETVRYESPFDFEKVNRHRLYRSAKSGIIYLDVLITPLGAGKDGASRGYLVQVQDITGRKQSEIELQRYREHLEDLIKERTNELVAVNTHLQREIDEHRRTEETLRESEERFRSLVEVTSDWIWEVDAHAIYTYASPKARDILGYEVHEIIGKTPFDLMPPEEAVRVKALFDPIVRARRPFFRLENVNRHKNGRTVVLETSGVPVFDAGGRFTGYRGIDRDISERKQAEMEYRTMLHVALDGFWVTDMQGRFVDVNDAYCRLIGYSREELLGMRITDVEAAESPEETARHIRLIREKGRDRFETCHRTKDGRVIDIEVSVNYMEVHGGRLFAYLRDITGRKKAQRELTESYDKLQRLTNGIIATIATIIETRDPYTAGHENRVAQLASAIAREMGLSPERIAGLSVAAVIHDIGKLFVPAEILSKPGALSRLEFNIVKNHSRAGYDVLKIIDFPWPIAQIVLQHQERYNGSGYPSGLSGESILLEARILAVADVVEAMSFHRPYRSAKGPDAAINEITDNEGTLYDPRVVEVCLKLLKERKFAFSKEEAPPVLTP